MELEQQLTSLDLSKALKEAGVPQKSLFVWSKQGDLKTQRCEYHKYFAVDMRKDVAAFSVAELGEMLSVRIDYGGRNQILIYSQDERGHFISYEDSKTGKVYEMISDKSEANARAKMILYLIEEKLLKF